MLLHRFLTDSASRFPDKVALVCGERRATYAELESASNALAASMAAAGLAQGDRVAVFLDNRPETVVALFAILKAGAAFMPVNPSTKAAKLIRLLQDISELKMIQTAEELHNGDEVGLEAKYDLREISNIFRVALSHRLGSDPAMETEVDDSLFLDHGQLLLQISDGGDRRD